VPCLPPAARSVWRIGYKSDRGSPGGAHAHAIRAAKTAQCSGGKPSRHTQAITTCAPRPRRGLRPERAGGHHRRDHPHTGPRATRRRAQAARAGGGRGCRAQPRARAAGAHHAEDGRPRRLARGRQHLPRHNTRQTGPPAHGLGTFLSFESHGPHGTDSDEQNSKCFVLPLLALPAPPIAAARVRPTARGSLLSRCLAFAGRADNFIALLTTGSYVRNLCMRTKFAALFTDEECLSPSRPRARSASEKIDQPGRRAGGGGGGLSLGAATHPSGLSHRHDRMISP
jgi:hypothetical protein